ncbi:glycosyltransferase family 2 protein [Lutibacter flavus]|uniref:Glycosyltransferase, GT2 family n=1 Tax=Lutibacter flavus TaxID=691689 RepID=A0A238VQR2_9FLAO|nr:glycosyltransferase family A protein [Lutibacter flavus]SNR36487.1 Glycosyltransferase, GT2 family [Lutibacter flavus]
MILVFHNNDKVVEIFDYANNQEIEIALGSIQERMLSIAFKNKSRFIGWCHHSLKEDLNLSEWNSILKHQLLLVSFETSDHFYITSSIGYVEDTPFINVNKKVKYPTWLMSSDVGVIHASVLLKFEYLLKYRLTLNLFLNNIAKIGMKQGLLCYSNPSLLKKSLENKIISKKNISTIDLLWFVKSNYRFRWILLYGLNLFIYKKRFIIFPFFRVLFKNPIRNKISFDDLKLKVYRKSILPTIDVLIPTLGREKYLKEVLLDLTKQTLLPKKVIIVEQIPNKGETTKLDFLAQKWPFEIDYTLIYQLGACNSRNIGLQKVSSDWVFFADDDVRFEDDLLRKAFNYIDCYGENAITISCLQENKVIKQQVVTQSSTFGSGTSIVKSSIIKKIKFDMAYEFGYGEDSDFGMQLRNLGTDILYVPTVKMLHLKAPIGGFRSEIYREWDKELIQPKPSPTVMVYNLKHATEEQKQSYKTTLFFKFYRIQSVKNPIEYYKLMNKMWVKSIYWANFLIKQYSNEI